MRLRWRPFGNQRLELQEHSYRQLTAALPSYVRAQQVTRQGAILPLRTRPDERMQLLEETTDKCRPLILQHVPFLSLLENLEVPRRLQRTARHQPAAVGL
ncbi:hypothetical protein PHYPSEUDO_003394 [Phytophthora pseudosyringae]|uniref:Uncharacterized protein n=1 Tax=Phytophthora pseudosyringae TaxID=221518 RepID=A0A8T1VQS4_9STRA|nr:hypothetical protein PHYPSEUDO_003394 [Phytophthora pseudosyringae]